METKIEPAFRTRNSRIPITHGYGETCSEPKEDRSREQFLEAVRKNQHFLEYIRSEMSTEGSYELPLSPDPMTEDEFKAPPRRHRNQVVRIVVATYAQDCMPLDFLGKLHLPPH